jgi:hypothetical protein
VAFAAFVFGLGLAAPAGAIDLLKSVEEAVEGFGGSSGTLSDQEVGDGLVEALRVGTERVVGQVSADDGYNLDPDIHIPLPGALKDVQKVLKSIGMSDLTDDLELRLNRAAEAAAPEAQELFWEAIGEMSFDDVQQIYNGPDDAATRYFQDMMTPQLEGRSIELRGREGDGRHLPLRRHRRGRDPQRPGGPYHRAPAEGFRGELSPSLLAGPDPGLGTSHTRAQTRKRRLACEAPLFLCEARS